MKIPLEKVRLPVNYKPVFKVIPNQLSASSWGVGVNSRSVTHIQVLEDLQSGRLIRKAGELLCGADKEFDLIDSWEDVVECKKCVELLIKHKFVAE